MKRLIEAEVQRIWINKKTRILLMLIIVDTILSCIFRLKCPSGSYDAKNYTVALNSLNFSPFIYQEVSLVLLYIALPIIFIDSINYEQITGAFRMYMIRPYKKYEFMISKWISLALTTFILMFIVFAISTIFGYLFMPKVSTVTFYNIQHKFNALGALLYIAKFYMIQFLVLLSILSIASIISVIISNSVISILSVIGSIAILTHFTNVFEFLWKNVKYGFYTLGHTVPVSEHIAVLALIVCGLFMGIEIWIKKDYLY
ncbi:membrane protein [Clostridium carboxidivorans P7]|uniref:Uncharacterized protein n=1 Tax=Clostridium carboxidivorans P7 TaxID=536227 RepID=C6PUE4_9CLOT|nr:ABC transporter permease [Clostridium carboxidivorans]AKN30556.1 membrane protein [Clostridium carboxidivorans P7]EET87142.1 conserved hypothetical protein [Clostridium carboxidivorans P7]EFG86302.1 membrane protein, putative [Clostridium carboxidivorans P7]